MIENNGIFYDVHFFTCNACEQEFKWYVKVGHPMRIPQYCFKCAPVHNPNFVRVLPSLDKPSEQPPE